MIERMPLRAFLDVLAKHGIYLSLSSDQRIEIELASHYVGVLPISAAAEIQKRRSALIATLGVRPLSAETLRDFKRRARSGDLSFRQSIQA